MTANSYTQRLDHLDKIAGEAWPEWKPMEECRS